MTAGGASRFAGWPRWAALLLLAACLALSVYGAASGEPEPVKRLASSHSHRDVDLYKVIAHSVHEGEDYYSAAVSAQREENYPLRPFVTVRLPTLAWLIALIGPGRAALLLAALAFAAVVALALRLKEEIRSKPAWIAAILLSAAAAPVLAQPGMIWWHELWAGLLIALSLGIRSRDRWALSLAAGVAAALFREHAGIYLVVMAGCAAIDRRWKEAAAWNGAVLLFAGALALHAHAVSLLVTPQDPASPGWNSFGGWPFVLAIAKRCTLFALLPSALSAAAVPLALLGWAGLQGESGRRIAAVLLAYTAIFLTVGRPENFYWGLLIALLLPMGLAFAPSALGSLLRPWMSGRTVSPMKKGPARSAEPFTLSVLDPLSGDRP